MNTETPADGQSVTSLAQQLYKEAGRAADWYDLDPETRMEFLNKASLAMAQNIETETRNIFSSKSGVLHAASSLEAWHTPGLVYTNGTWKNGEIRGASRVLDGAKLTPAGTLTLTFVDGVAQGYTYDAYAAHI